jgi:hypothetical protein
MPYRLKRDETVEDGLRRCAREQLDRAVDELTTGIKDDPVSAVHDARKALKKTQSSNSSLPGRAARGRPGSHLSATWS